MLLRFVTRFKKIHFLLFLLTMSLLSMAQRTVSGKVIASDNKQPIPGATVVVKGSKTTTVTDNNGEFSIPAGEKDLLIISNVGFGIREVKATESGSVALIAETKNLDEVVVTALGIKKETRKLGYSVQEVKGADLLKAREPNAINGLVGKVAGLSVGASAEILGRPQVLLRGNSINFFVIDGVPVNSDTWNISPDDIESYSILKGPTAAALYGNRAINGAIIINTKKGSKDKRGFSVEFNSSTMFDRGFNAIPKVQDEYGPGDHGRYSFVDGRGGGLNDGDYDIWGPKFEGQLIPQYDSPIDPATGTRTATPWVARGKDNLSRFIQTGLLSTNNISVSSSTEKSDLRFSLSNTYQKGIVPNTKLNGFNFNTFIGHNFSPKLRFEANVNYNRQGTPNVPDVNYGPNSMIYNIIIWGGADWDIDDMKNYWQPGKEGVQQIYAEYQRYNNPWFLVKEWLRGHYLNYLNGYTSLSFKINNNLEVLGRTSVSTYDLLRTEKFPYSATTYGREEARGDYREDIRKLFENNTELLVKFNKKFFSDLSISGLVGGNARNMRYNSNFTTTDYLNVPGVYTFANSRNPVKAANFSSEMLVLSAYSSLDVSYKNYINVGATIRWDKSSAIPDSKPGTYPSVSVSTAVSDYVKMPSAISFLKLKASYASVRDGGTQAYIGPASYPIGYGAAYTTAYDGPSYNLVSKVYNTRLDYNNSSAAYYTDNLYDDIKTANRSNYEAGFDIRFLKNRLSLDAVYFTYIDGPQIFRNPISQATGYTSLFINAAKYATKGVEFTINGNPIKAKSGFSWDVLFNWSTYRQTYKELPSDSILVGDIYVKPGDRLDMYQGRAYARTEDGQIINDGGGRPIVLPKNQILGYANPDWVWGLTNKFFYKNFNLAVQIDGRVGGKMENYIRRQTFRGGRHIETVQGAMGEARYQDYLGVKSWVGEGVVITSGTPTYDPVTGQITNYKDLTFAPNTTKTFLQDYISRYNSQAEGNLMSKTFAKLREITLGYTLPSSILGNSFIRGASVSFVARNLFYFTDKKHKDVDIDQYAGSQTSSNLQSPTVKRFGFNVNLVF
ncbi:SusC/RagA family TonB-linked outer membrane protein [Terrimonas pollutisoli]|uniref:SusC/RagA family TonB-linked outer membrane protein n=1 Tax=Terrimonas pollutisoli TaxID=3034147 RepID=UPI0023ED3DE0|nr:SusC/RagA family TonB-linked outer membrane protein [Terrimonas sp. H1YJ31]